MDIDKGMDGEREREVVEKGVLVDRGQNWQGRCYTARLNVSVKIRAVFIFVKNANALVL